MKKIAISISLFLIVGCLSTKQQPAVSSTEKKQTIQLPSTTSNIKLQKYRQDINRDYQKIQKREDEHIYEYTKRVLYETNYQAETLLDYAKFSTTPYLSIKKAFDIHREMQNGLFAVLDSEQKLDYMRGYKRYIDRLFQATRSKDEIRESFNRWINYKRSLFDDENGFDNRLSHDRYIRAKKRIIDRKKRELARERNPQKIASLQGDIKNFERSLSVDMYERTSPETIDYREISALLRDDEIYIDFAKTENRYYLFILDKKGEIQFEYIDAIQTKEIERYIRRIIEDLDNAPLKITKKRYNKLYNLIFDKIETTNRSSIIISPDGLLNAIPFEAFNDGKKYLIERFDIRYIPSGKEFVKLYQNNTQSDNKIIVFANPYFDLEQNSIKGTAIKRLHNQKSHFRTLNNLDEPNIINRLYKNRAKIYLGKEATESNFFKIKSPKILHLSTHGFYLRDETILNPMLKAGIALSGANSAIKNQKGDGIITALELSGMDLSHTELVVLSACETGVGEIEDGEGVAGLSKAFIKAGAKYIVMSLWSVPEKSTGELMERFYENLHRGDSYSEALRSAKVWMIENKNSHPFYWSGFVGSGRVTKNSTK